MRILLADDDQEVLTPLEIALRREGFEVLAARDGARAWDLFTAERPDFAVLDVTMPGVDGLELTRRIARSGTPPVPVILLTGRDQDRDKVAALDLGADDYVVKPCSHRELIARIRAVWRRAGQPLRTLTIGGMTSEPTTHHVYVEGRPVEVTATEFALLFTLGERAGQVLQGATIMKRVWGSPVSNDLLRMTVYRLRHKIEPEPRRPRYIHNVHGVGFMLRDGELPDGSSPAAEEHSP